jgi:hypothetical protein
LHLTFGREPILKSAMYKHKARSLLTLSIVGSILAACGGGGDTATTSVPAPVAATPAPAPVAGGPPVSPAPAPVPAPAPSGSPTNPAPVPVPSPSPVPPPVTPPATPPPVGTGLPNSFGAQGMVLAGAKLFAYSDPASAGLATRVGSSTDGTNWTIVDTPTLPTGMGRVRFVNNQYIATGKRGLVLSSADANAWTKQTFPSTDTTYDIAFGGGRYILAGTAQAGVNKGLFISTDGASWTAITATNLPEDVWKGVTYGAGKFVAVGEKGQVATSTDGSSWSIYKPAGFLIQMQQVAYSESARKFLAVGNFGTIYTSADGLTWSTLISSSLPNILQLECVAARCVMTTSINGNAAVDDFTYTIETSNAQDLYIFKTTTKAIAFGINNLGSQWIATGEKGLVMTSQNGQTWRVVSP